MEPHQIENPEIPPLSSPLPDDRRDLITKILQHQDLDSLLRLSVVLCNHELQGDGCSLFMYDEENSEIVLKESTVLTRFLGQRVRVNREETQDVIETIRTSIEGISYPEDPWTRTLPSDEDELDPVVRELIFHFGLTRWSYWFNTPLLIDDVRNDLRWSSYKRGGSGVFLMEPAPQPADVPTKELGHCELHHHEMGSIAIVPIGQRLHGISRAVLRVVRKRNRPSFQAADLDWLKWFAEIVGNRIDTAISLSDLTDLGTRLEVPDFGRTLVKLLRRTLKAKGCSIFLEMDRQDPESKERVFQCVATNGLVSNGRRIDLEARYEIRLDKEDTDHLTSWVLRHGELIALKDVHNFDVSDFPKELHRKPGKGKFSETDVEGQKFEVGPILIAPLFLYQGREVAGAIRISRPRGEIFETHEQLLFLDISKRLSRVLTNLHLRQLSEKMIELYNSPDEMLKRIPREVCRLLGVDGCSVLLRHGDMLTLEATAGALKGKEGGIQYDLRDPQLMGWTGWVAHTKRALLLNSPADEDQYEPPPRHAKEERHKPCETGEHAHRFLAVPILGKPGESGSEVFGVVRVPRKKTDPPFEEIHQSILVSFAGRLSLALTLARRIDDLSKSLVTVGTQMTTESPLRAKLAIIAEAAAQVTQADNVIVHEYLGPPPEDGSSRGRFRNSACGGPRPPSVWREVDQSRDAVPFRIVERREPIFAVSAEQSEVIFHRKAKPNFIEREKIRSVAGLPLRVGDTCVGCIFFNFASQQDFQPQQRQEIQMMADYAAVAIYQARLLEETRKLVEETRKLAHEKSKLLLYAEHSLNQPLNALQGYLSNLSFGIYNSELSPNSLHDPGLYRQSPFSHRAEQQHRLCRYLSYLVEMFLHIDRLEAGHPEPWADDRINQEIFHIHPMPDRDLSELCHRAAGVIEAYLLGSAFGTVARHIQPKVTGCFDENTIQISLLNILVNAAKYGKSKDPASPLEIRLTLKTTEEGGTAWAQILVEDSGPGIDPEDKERIFEKGFRKDDGPGGLGIGLFLTRGYVDAHGGEVRLHPSRFGGAGFMIRLPLTRR